MHRKNLDGATVLVGIHAFSAAHAGRFSDEAEIVVKNGLRNHCLHGFASLKEQTTQHVNDCVQGQRGHAIAAAKQNKRTEQKKHRSIIKSPISSVFPS